MLDKQIIIHVFAFVVVCFFVDQEVLSMGTNTLNVNANAVYDYIRF